MGLCSRGGSWAPVAAVVAVAWAGVGALWPALATLRRPWATFLVATLTTAGAAFASRAQQLGELYPAAGSRAATTVLVASGALWGIWGLARWRGLGLATSTAAAAAAAEAVVPTGSGLGLGLAAALGPLKQLAAPLGPVGLAAAWGWSVGAIAEAVGAPRAGPPGTHAPRRWWPAAVALMAAGGAAVWGLHAERRWRAPATADSCAVLGIAQLNVGATTPPAELHRRQAVQHEELRAQGAVQVASSDGPDRPALVLADWGPLSTAAAAGGHLVAHRLSQLRAIVRRRAQVAGGHHLAIYDAAGRRLGQAWPGHRVNLRACLPTASGPSSAGLSKW